MDRRRRERVMRVLWGIGSPGLLGRVVGEARKERWCSGRRERAERIRGVLVRRTMVGEGPVLLLDRITGGLLHL